MSYCINWDRFAFFLIIVFLSICRRVIGLAFIVSVMHEKSACSYSHIAFVRVGILICDVVYREQLDSAKLRFTNICLLWVFF